MNRKNITLVVIIVCIIVVVVGYEVLGLGNRGDIVVSQPKVEEINKIDDNIEVYIIGCVKNPGTYEVPRGVTVGKVADKAGGFTEGADLNRINLVYKIKDNRMIVIKDKKEREERERAYRQKNNVRGEDKSACGDIANKTKCNKDGVNNCYYETEEYSKKNSPKKKSNSSAKKSSNKKKVQKKDNIVDDEANTACVAGNEGIKTDDMVVLDDVMSVAKTLEEETKSCDAGMGDTIEVLPNNRGIHGNEQESGMEVVEGLYVDERVEESTMVNINTATKEELMKLKGVGESMADKIIQYREDNGDFKEINELKLVSGMGENKFNKIKDNIAV